MFSTLLLISFLECTVLIITIHMKQRGRRGYRQAKAIQRINSTIYALFSLILGICMLLPQPIDSLKNLGYIYHLSKFYESIDIFLFLLSGNIPNLHFVVHHATTPILTMDAVIGRPPRDWRLCAIANLLHHTFIYAYFGGYTAFRPVLVYSGSLQLGLGIAACARAAFITGGQHGVIGLVLYTSYALLYIKELQDSKKKLVENS